MHGDCQTDYSLICSSLLSADHNATKCERCRVVCFQRPQRSALTSKAKDISAKCLGRQGILCHELGVKVWVGASSPVPFWVGSKTYIYIYIYTYIYIYMSFCCNPATGSGLALAQAGGVFDYDG